MACKNCGKKSEIELRCLGSLCSKCFLKIIEKRVRKDARLGKFIKKHDKILVVNDNSKEFFATEFLLKSIIKDMPCEVVAGKFKSSFDKKIEGFVKKNKINKVIVPWDADDEIEVFMVYLFEGKTPAKTSHIKLLRSVLDEEVAAFAKIKKFKFKQQKKPKIQQKMDYLESKYPGSKFSLLKVTSKISIS